jgi:nuclear pore complex protein Nup160
MPTGNVPFLFKETRINLEPRSVSSVVQINIPSPNGIYKKPSSHRAIGAGNQVFAEDERVYRAKNLATASAVYHRKHHSSPRSFLWRVLENDTVLSVRAADLCKEDSAIDATLILDLHFSNPIRTSCLDFSDPTDLDALCIFIVDHANHLYTITLRPEVFRKKAVTEGGLSDACIAIAPSGLGFKNPHRLVAVRADQLVVTMHDGGIIRYDKNKAYDGLLPLPWS